MRRFNTYIYIYINIKKYTYTYTYLLVKACILKDEEDQGIPLKHLVEFNRTFRPKK